MIRGRWWWGAAVACAAVVVAAFALRERLPSAGEVGAALGTADPRWVAAGVGLQVLAQASFAVQQQLLVRAAGLAPPFRDTLAMTLGSTAIGLALPAGSALSATYMVRQYRRWGAGTAAAAAFAVMSGVASVAGLLAAVAFVHPLVGLGLAVPVAGYVLVRRQRPGDPAGRIARHWHAAVAAVHAVGLRNGAVMVACSAVNRLFEAGGLVAAAAAFDFPVRWTTVAAAYLTVQAVRQIPLTPGGIGLVEAALLAALSLQGPASTAAAVVLTYRLVSFWLVLPLGLAGYLSLERTPARAPAGDYAGSNT